ncbi:MAG: hypothetical protein R3E32_13385 [Chitinophagales bacterium]
MATTTSSFLERERKSLERMKRFQLPHYFKKIGMGLAIFSFIALFANAFSVEIEAIRWMAKYGLLGGMLLISISKDEIEDEFITKLRMQSYTFAFIAVVLFTLAQPFINFLVDFIVEGGEAVFKDMGDFEILWFLLSVQVFYFMYLKKLYR